MSFKHENAAESMVLILVLDLYMYTLQFVSKNKILSGGGGGGGI